VPRRSVADPVTLAFGTAIKAAREANGVISEFQAKVSQEAAEKFSDHPPFPD